MWQFDFQYSGRLNQMTQMDQTAADKRILGVISCILKGIPHGSKWGQNQDFENGAHLPERFCGWFIITSEGSLNMSEDIFMDFRWSFSDFIWARGVYCLHILQQKVHENEKFEKFEIWEIWKISKEPQN